MTLKTGSQQDIVNMFTDMRKDVSATLKSVITLVYFMRGSISYTDMMNMSYAERQMVNDFISERLELESKRMHPVY
jgi:hypothetical protein